MARAALSMMLVALMGSVVYVYLLSGQLNNANSSLNRFRSQMEELQGQIDELDDPILQDGPTVTKEDEVVESLTRDMQAAYLLQALLKEESARPSPETVRATDVMLDGSPPAPANPDGRLSAVELELLQTKSALERMKQLYARVYEKMDVLLKERDALIRENRMLRNEIAKILKLLPRERFTQDVLK